MQCKDHKLHIKFNVRDCVIQKHSQCQKHWIDHPENFEGKNDIEVKKKLLFHNNYILKNGQNYQLKCVQYAGLKIFCKECKIDTREHFVNHLTAHLQCKHCRHELKTMGDELFWQRVCSLCGKEFKTVSAKKEHVARHAIPSQTCSLCDLPLSSKFNLKRHMIEQHNLREDDSSEDETDDPHLPFTCHTCGKVFVNQRNLDSHVDSFHINRNPLKCKVCGQTFRKAFNLKEHLKNQHKIVESSIVVESKMPNTEETYECKICKKVFSEKRNLKQHIEGIHENKLYECEFCDKTYSRKEKMMSHVAKHHNS